MAQATTAAPVVPIGPAPNVSVQPKPMAVPPCDKPGGMGLARIVEIDTTGGPGFGFEHFKQYDFLRDKEVVPTFDDGPWPGTRPPYSRRCPTNASRRLSSRSASTPPGIRRSPSGDCGRHDSRHAYVVA